MAALAEGVDDGFLVGEAGLAQAADGGQEPVVFGLRERRYRKPEDGEQQP